MKNSNNVTVGEVIASGIQFSSLQRLSGVTTCFRMPQVTPTLYFQLLIVVECYSQLACESV